MRTPLAGELERVVDQVGEGVLELRRGNQLRLGKLARETLDGDIELDFRAAIRLAMVVSKAENGTHVNGRSASQSARPSDFRISRQRRLWGTSSAMSSASGLSSGTAWASSHAVTAMARERAAQIMGGGRGQTAESGQLLLAGERHLRGRERIRQPARLIRDAPGVPGDQSGTQNEGEPQAPT